MQMGRMNYGVFWVFPIEISAHILSLFVPIHDFSLINNHYFYQRFLRHFKEKCILVWNMNLGFKELGMRSPC